MRKFLVAASNLGGGLTVKDDVVNISAKKLYISGDALKGYKYIKTDDDYIGNYDELFYNNQAQLGVNFVVSWASVASPTFVGEIYSIDGQILLLPVATIRADLNALIVTTYEFKPDNTISLTEQEYAFASKT